VFPPAPEAAVSRRHVPRVTAEAMFADAKPAGDAPPTLVANNAACNNNV